MKTNTHNKNKKRANNKRTAIKGKQREKQEKKHKQYKTKAHKSKAVPCMAPMATPTTCERNHHQKVTDPKDLMKIQAKMGPLGNPDDSFILHSLVASQNLVGFSLDEAETVDWNEWSAEYASKEMTIRVKVDKNYDIGGYKVTLYSVLPDLASLLALPPALKITLD